MAKPPLTLKTRRDFTSCARARRQAMPAFVVQGRKRSDDANAPYRVGYTCSKKVGNAVARNRAKRRLRALAAEVFAGSGKAGWDYVLIGRAETTASRPFAELITDLQRALSRLHAPRKT